MATTIVTKNSSTASAVPTAAQLVQGELAVNVADKRLYTEDNAGAVVELGTNPSTLTVTGEITANGGIALGDSDKATFGAGDDLQIYHDGSNSYVQDSGTGDLIVRANNLALQATSGEQYAAFVANGAASLFYDNSQKLTTTATGIDVTGTATMDGFVVTGTLGNFAVDTQGAIAAFSRPSTSYIRASDVSGALRFDTGGSIARLNIANNGDISFYEDTGTTAKLFWDASVERLGIGTSSPTANLEIEGTSVEVDLDNTTASTGRRFRLASVPDGSFLIRDQTAATERMRIDASGNVGIGSTSANGSRLRLDNGGTSGAPQLMLTATGASTQTEIRHDTSNNLIFDNWNSGRNERMRIDSSGNLFVGKSNVTESIEGVELRADGWLKAIRSGDYAATLRRNDSDGGILEFNKDGTAVGSIGAKGTDLTIGNTVTGLQFYDAGNALAPVNVTTNANTDGATDLGIAGARFKNLYLSGGLRNDTLTFSNLAGAERMRIDSSGNLLLNTLNSPTTTKAIISSDYSAAGTTNTGLTITGRQGGNWYNNGIHALGSSGLVFSTGTIGVNGADATNERMRIDSSGNLLVGTTNTAPASSGNVAGSSLLAIGKAEHSRDGGVVLALNRKTSDGDIVDFRKDGTTVGSIGTAGGDLLVGTGDTAFRFHDGDNRVYPVNASTGIKVDGAVDLGDPTGRFKDLYLSGGLRGDTLTFKNLAGTERMRIDSSGNLLVGTTSGDSKLHVGSNLTSLQAFRAFGNTAGDTSNTCGQFGKFDNNSTTSQVFVNFTVNNGGTAQGQINANGAGAVAFGSWSDSRLKENITDLPNQLANITALRPVEFDYIESEGGGHQLGFIAQEVEEIYPDLVGERSDGMKTLSGLGKWEARLVKAIQEQQTLIELLTTRIAALEE